MSPANLQELLTAAVDGELTSAERKTARRLLRESEAARVLYAQLKADAARLKKLPRVLAPADLVDDVLGMITDRAIRPTPLPPTRRPASRFNWGWLPVWANIAAAVGVLVAVTLGSYFYFAASDRYFAAKNQQMSAALPAVTPGDHETQRTAPASHPEPRDRRADVVADRLVERPRLVNEIGPDPHEVVDLQTGPLPDAMPEIEPFNPEKIRVSHLVRLDDLATDVDARKKLATEMKKDELIRVDLFCQAPAKAYERVVAAFKAWGVMTLTDAYAHDRFKKNLPTEIMVFTEALTPDEVAQLMAALGAEDKKTGAGLFDTLVAAPFLGSDLDKLGKLLGAPNFMSAPPRGKAAIDIRKPLPEGTAQHVANSLNGMGGSPRPTKPELMALVVSYSPTNPSPAMSREIKQFVDRRGDRKPDAKPFMLVLKSIPK